MYSKSFSVLLIGAQCVNIHREKLSINTVDLQKLFTDRSRPVYLQSALRSGSFYLDVPLEMLCPELLAVVIVRVLFPIPGKHPTTEP